jgi:hypothetical protein
MVAKVRDEAAMEPHEAAERLEQLMAHRDALFPFATAARDSAEFRAFLAAEHEVGDFIAEHDAELEPLRLPRDGMTDEKYQARLDKLDRELAWLEPHAARSGPAAAAYDAAWKDRMAFVANYRPDAGTGPPGPEPEPELDA